MVEEIKGFFDRYEFLSNFYPAPFTWQGIRWRTSEHAYQAMKSESEMVWKFVASLQYPNDAKNFCRTKVVKRGDWEIIKYDVMDCVLFEKFEQNLNLTRRLLATGTAFLEETNTWHDNVWGNCNCRKCVSIEGKNNLGLALMQLRQKIMNV